ncbi:MAG: tetratricopeptide repeat protein [Pseudomonadota bacterium]
MGLLLFVSACSSLPSLPGSQKASPRAETEVKTEAGEPQALREQTVVPPAVANEYANAVFLMEAGDQQGAEAQFRQFASRYPEYPAPWVNLAIIAAAQGRDADALTALEKALAINPDYAPALNQLGILYRKTGQFSDAEAAYLKAVTVQPDYALAHLNLGILLDLYLGRLPEALTAYQSYQALTPDEDKLVARWITDLTRRTGGQ